MIESSYESMENHEEDVSFSKMTSFSKPHQSQFIPNERLTVIENEKNKNLTANLNHTVITNFQKIFGGKNIVNKTENLLYLEPKKIRHQDRITDLFKILFSNNKL